MTAPDQAPAARCPKCAAAVVRVGGEAPWCPACEWNLAEAVGEDARDRRSRARGRAARRSFDADGRLFADIASHGPRRPGWSSDRLALVTISLALGAAQLAVLALGIALVVFAPWWWKIAGALLAGVAIESRPRLPGPDTTLGYKSRVDAPALFAVIDAVAAQIGAPPVHGVVVTESFEATCGRFGLRRRPVLILGLPLWASLSPAGRLGLLAHQLAHLVDRDPEQSLVIQPALSTFGVLAEQFAMTGRIVPEVKIGGSDNLSVSADQYYAMVSRQPGKDTLESIAQACLVVIFAPLSWISARADGRLHRMAARLRQRAEYYADDVAADVAGTAGAIEYCEALLLHEQVYATARRLLSAGADADAVRLKTADVLASSRAELRLREQHSMRAESSPLAGHPPTGRRLRILRLRPTSAARLSPRTLDLAAVDTQLQSDYRRVTRALIHLP